MPETALEPLFRYGLPIAEDPIRRVIDRRVPWAIHGEVFSQQSFGTGPWPDQGWKLHVSATPLSATQVLEAALDVLLAEGVRFKVTGSITLLAALNAGEFGPSQIGKFITVYPCEDTQAVRLAVSLDAVTRDRRGPRVPTDRPLRPDSLVHYRYGAMRQRPEAAAAGQAAGDAYDLLDPAGRLTGDYRLQYYQPPPAEIVDPFEAAGAYIPRPARGTLLNGRYLVNNALAQPPRGGVFRAVDLAAQPPRLCLLKEAWHDVSLDQYGRDARDWAANEERILSRYAGDPFLPLLYESFELDGNRYVAIEYVEGRSLDRVLEDKHSPKEGIQPSDVLAIGLATADALAHLHEIGIVFRDFKPGNLIETPDGDYRLIDFGIAYQYREDSSPAVGLGTPPFYPREQENGEHPSPADDIFAWGAVLHYLACGEASLAGMPRDGKRQRPFARGPIAGFRAAFPPALAAVIDRAVAWERADRYTTMIEARDALAQAASGLDADQAPAAITSQQITAPPAPIEREAAEELLLAREVGDALCAAAEQQDGGLRWAVRGEWSEDIQYSPDLYDGAAGIGLFLAELAFATGERRYADTARGAARWLAGPAWGRGRAQHGLHCGEGGAAYFFLRLAELLHEPGYVDAAQLRMRQLRGANPVTVDLLYGTAGTILSLLSTYAATRQPEYLIDARAAGDALVRAALPVPQRGKGCYWEVVAALPGRPATPYLGLLHGAAGMALALARLAEATGEERYLGVAQSAAEMLLAQVIESKEGALSWPRQLGDKEASLQAHCHGAGGIGQFFLRLNRLVPDQRYRQAALGAARTVAAQRELESRSSICHGLSGTANLLLDCYQAFGEQQWLTLARDCGGRLQRFRAPFAGAAPARGKGFSEGQPAQDEAEEPERPKVYAMNLEGAVSPDLMLGYAGVGSLWLRLANAETLPELVLG